MKIKKHLTNRYAVFCTNCKHELSIYSTFSLNKFALKCNACNQGFIFERKENRLTPSNTTDEIEELWKYDEYHQYYKGVPTSQAFMPKWIRSFFGKR